MLIPTQSHSIALHQCVFLPERLQVGMLCDTAKGTFLLPLCGQRNSIPFHSIVFHSILSLQFAANKGAACTGCVIFKEEVLNVKDHNHAEHSALKIET